jgi:hypothetical protein
MTTLMALRTTYDLPTTMKRRNRHVPLGNGGGVRLVNLPDLHGGAGLRVSPASFIYPSKLASGLFLTLSLMALVSEQVPLSIYVITDLDTEDGRSVIHAALAFIVRRVNPCFLLSDLTTYPELCLRTSTFDVPSQPIVTERRPRTAHTCVFVVFAPHIQRSFLESSCT